MSDEPNLTPAASDEGDPGEQNPSILTGATDDPKPGEEGDAPADKGEEDTSVPKTDGDDPSDDGEGGDKASGDDQDPPESYSDFDLPEGMSLNEELLNEAVPLFKELGLNQEQAQKLIDFQAKQVQEGLQKQTDQFSQLIDDWQTQSKNDKEFGGDKFDENVSIAQLAVNKLGTPEFKQLMEDHGVGNHPEMIRFMWNVGKMVKEDQPGNLGSGTTTPTDRVSIMYPKD